ncbi:thioredoxin family protein [Chitinophaga eiseniae]|uniref:Thioredoxin fold domain-containing protein n=1 Tax=Chitinophaga eiseniae TaxID=634771 RepID=A0A847SC39_9BACT|nr:thioredoxin family protein [Chitinophaga eiseniae]NLR77303.1 thioredoxin fold domain-containing protein [Chitinophaga eiseniae]
MKRRLLMIPLLLACLLFAAATFAQEGIRFRSNSLAALKQQAIAEKKLIFIDCYTSWCAPCKWMDHNVFTLPAVAEQYNRNFINARFDMEKGEGMEIRKQYTVSSFPTYLFVDANGKLVYRSGSRMSAEEFMTVGENANDPAKGLASLQQQYDNGKRDMQFMLDFYSVLHHYDRNKQERIGEEIVSNFPEEQLNSALGWKAIRLLARTDEDRLGGWFMKHQADFKPFARQGEIDTMANRLTTSLLFGYMRDNKDELFWKRIDFFRKSTMPARKKEGLMMEAEFYLARKDFDNYIRVANAGLKGVLNDDPDKLSFLARRSGSRGVVEPKTLPVSYAMAKRAVVLDPKEYSTQSTLAQICLEMKRKEEGLEAAKKAYALAETSKIEKIVQQLIDQLNAL